MDADSLDFLKNFLAEPSPSGNETAAAACFRARILPFADRIETDVLGNTLAVLNPDSPFKVMLAGHCDEIGFQVTYLSEDGLIYFRAAGGVTRQALPGTEIEILTNKGRVPGVIACKPIHFMTDGERDKAPEIKGLWMDVGVENKAALEALAIRVGDPVSVRANVKLLGENRLLSKGLDDKIGAFVVAEVIRKLYERRSELKVGVYGVATVQEEIGLRGAKVSAAGIEPDVGFCIDVSFTTDTPDIDKKQIGDLALGRGPILVRNADNNPILGTRIRRIADAFEQPYQETAGRSATGGNDTSAMQMTAAGVASASFGIPNRYMHSPAEMVDLRDVEAAIVILVETILSLTPDLRFRPGIDF